ncbi:MAG TPA: hypothetical protein DD667_12420 [Gammaproteobacteria bacterium]|jgi:hypothetical protein|nr:hypothetical protein [Pseudomonadales bacterium]MAR93411.1 hypothetical protein [Pseudomonadales bacterium]HAG95951.1 hypothetical protein [Gammaproteobacteria bacterium]HAU16691.1 hypothetical protein [Gammaproteobacteria bacterium]HBO94081.1 hypothetical protein [Gammaproteobacteria bacterium]|tara:strand:+ start:1207 stop:1443 length:237 start_codon:yes stop_codon:yes gene_type:complete
MSASKNKSKKTTQNEISKTTAAHNELNDATITDSKKAQMIAEAAYYKAEKRQFCGCDEEKLMDWLEAETEINSQLSEK